MTVMKSAVLIALFAITCISARAQGDRFEFSGDFAGFYQSRASGQNVTDIPTYSGGFIANYRYHFNDWGAVEVNYSRNRYTQLYQNGVGLISSFTQATAQELSMAFIYQFWSRFNGRLQPFAEGGTGGVFWSPIAAGSVGGPFNQNRAALLYGGGVEWKWFWRISLRGGYRSLLFTAPDFNVDGQFTNKRTQMKEPYAGLTFRF
jgi:opacity protein-like surface antigen